MGANVQKVLTKKITESSVLISDSWEEFKMHNMQLKKIKIKINLVTFLFDLWVVDDPQHNFSCLSEVDVYPSLRPIIHYTCARASGHSELDSREQSNISSSTEKG